MGADVILLWIIGVELAYPERLV